jgi:chromatin segregation and condensation protein Rec8/ScpA/Scc1 (kleisin family)
MIRGMVTTVDLALLVADEVSTEDAVSDMMARLSRGPLTFGEAVSGRTLAWAVALFLAMLELSARGEVALSQGERLGDIEIDLLERAS